MFGRRVIGFDVSRRLLVPLAALSLSTIGWAGGARADTFNFAYVGNGISAVGTLTATLTAPGSGQYLVSSITGERNNVTITGLLAPGTYANPFGMTNDNILNFPPSPFYVDSNGIAYSAGGANYSIFSTAELTAEGRPAPGGGSVISPIGLTVSRGAPAPVPGGGLLSFLALGIVGLANRPRRIAGRVRRCLAALSKPAMPIADGR